MKKVIRLTESELIKVIKRLIKENDDDNDVLYDYMRTLDYIAGQFEFDENTTEEELEEELEYILDRIEYEIQSAVQGEELTDDQINELVKYADEVTGELINQNQLNDMPTYKTKWRYSDKDNQK
jgi:HEPN domain-containing protein